MTGLRNRIAQYVREQELEAQAQRLKELLHRELELFWNTKQRERIMPEPDSRRRVWRLTVLEVLAARNPDRPIKDDQDFLRIIRRVCRLCYAAMAV